MTGYDYLDRCVETAKEIDPEEIAAMRLGKEIGRGSIYATHSLGRIAVRECEIYVGLKRRHVYSGGATTRLLQEIPRIAWVVKRAPDLLNCMPVFMNAVMYEDDSYDEVGVLTEDVSKGGQNEIHQAPISAPLHKILHDAFKDMDNPRNFFDEDHLLRSMAFEVNGEEKFLDFTPSPFSVIDSELPELDAIQDIVLELIEGRSLRIDIPRTSPLANDVSNLV